MAEVAIAAADVTVEGPPRAARDRYLGGVAGAGGRQVTVLERARDAALPPKRLEHGLFRFVLAPMRGIVDAGTLVTWRRWVS